MKKLFLSACILGFTALASAQTETTTQQATSQSAPQTTTAAEAVVSQEAYNKIKQNEIAPAVLKQAVAKYKDYALVEALVAQDGSNYKLVLTKDGKDVAAYYKSTGEFIKEETV